jgi:hypothetical protein
MLTYAALQADVVLDTEKMWMDVRVYYRAGASYMS